jgi:hypothetical protein
MLVADRASLVLVAELLLVAEMLLPQLLLRPPPGIGMMGV